MDNLVPVRVEDSVLKSVAKTLKFDPVTSTNYASFLKMIEDFQKCCLTLRVSREEFESLVRGEKQMTDGFNGYMYPSVVRALDSTLLAVVNEAGGEELRYDTDGTSYTKVQFIQYYGGEEEWNLARPAGKSMDVFTIFRSISVYFEPHKLSNALQLVRATLSKISSCVDVEKRMMIGRQGLKDLVGMKLTEEDVESLACAFSLSTCPGGAEKYVVHYLTTSGDVSAVGLLQNFQANYGRKVEEAGPQLKKRRVDGRTEAHNQADEGKVDGFCSHCFKFGHKKAVCRSNANGNSQAKLRDKAKKLREKAVDGWVPRKVFEKAFEGRAWKQVDQKEFILLNAVAGEVSGGTEADFRAGDETNSLEASLVNLVGDIDVVM